VIFLYKKSVFSRKLQNYAKDIVLAHNENLSAIDLNLGAAVLAEQDLIAFLDINWSNSSIVANLTLTNGDNTSSLRALLRVVWKDDPAK
jgi:hypothetical protein